MSDGQAACNLFIDHRRDSHHAGADMLIPLWTDSVQTHTFLSIINELSRATWTLYFSFPPEGESSLGICQCTLQSLPAYRLANMPQQWAPAKKELHSLLLTVGWFFFKVKLFPFPVKPEKLCHMQFLCIMDYVDVLNSASMGWPSCGQQCLSRARWGVPRQSLWPGESAMQQLRPTLRWSRRCSTEVKHKG